jgi:hypothetical protein
MTETGPTKERLLRATARTISGGALHPLVVLQDVEDACLAAVNDDVLANQISLTFNPADHVRYAPGFDELRDAIDDLLDRLERSRGYRRLGPRSIVFTAEPEVPEGKVEVSARVAPATDRGTGPTPHATQRIERESNLMLMLGDVGVRLTHTPFMIGRGPGNDLVLASLSVSRNHARILRNGDRFMIEDVGSRNGLIVDGQPTLRAALVVGQRVKVGDIEVWIEETGA